MGYGFDSFNYRSQNLLIVARQLRDSLKSGPDAQSAIIDILLDASEEPAAGIRRMGFMSDQAATQGEDGSSPEDAVAAALFDLQAANILLAGSLAIGEADIDVTDQPLNDAIAHVDASRVEVLEADDGRSGFEGPETVVSADLDAAKRCFEDRGKAVLDEAVDGVGKVFRKSFDGIRKIDARDFTALTDRLGDVGAVIAGAGRLLRMGIEKLKSAIEALLSLFGQDSLDQVKDLLRQLWEAVKPDDPGTTLLARLLGVPAAQASISAALNTPSLAVTQFDRASKDLYGLSQGLARRIRMLVALAAGVGLISATLVIFAAAAQWLPLAAAAYALIAAAALLVGLEYIGSRQLLGRVEGVEQIAHRISAGEANP